MSILSLALVCSAHAQLPYLNGGVWNSYYEMVQVPGGVTWFEAKAAAEDRTYLGRKGHLATQSMGPEFHFIDQKLFVVGNYWLGAIKDPMASSAFPGTNWITGEPFPGLPGGGGFHYFGGVPFGNSKPGAALATCNSAGDWIERNPNEKAQGYIVEYSNVPPALDLTITFDSAPFEDWRQATVKFHTLNDNYAQLIYTAWINPEGKLRVAPPAGLEMKSVSIEVFQFLTRRVDFTPGTAPFSYTMDLVYGDVNSDDIMNTDDYLIFSNSFDSGEGDPHYEPAADLTRDGFVTTDDYLIISPNFDTKGDNFIVGENNLNP